MWKKAELDTEEVGAMSLSPYKLTLKVPLGAESLTAGIPRLFEKSWGAWSRWRFGVLK